MNSSIIIGTKLMPPLVKNTMVRRAKLYQKLRKITDFPVTLIHSGAGYGKSTALSLYVYDTKMKACWYSISSHDDDIIPFLTYIVHSIRQQYPEFGSILLNHMEYGDQYIRDEEIFTLSSIFINELSTINQEIVLILDDFHHVEESIAISLFMQALLEHFPPNLHVVLSGRSKPQWKPLIRLKVQGNLIEIGQEDLVLSMEEVEILLSDHYELTLTEDVVEELFSITEGWAIALGIMGLKLQDEVEITSVLKDRSHSLEDLFHYIALEVLLKQSPLVQNFLEQTSILEELTVESCEAVIGLHGADSMLESLASKNLFISTTGKKQYRYHALFKELLEKRLKEERPSEYRQLNERAARYYERKGLLETSLYHLEKSGRFEAVAKILFDYGMNMLKEGKIQGLFERLRKIPDNVKEKYYVLWFYEGEILRLRSNYESAETCYEKAIFHSQLNKDMVTESRAYEGKARIYLDTIQPGKAERYLQIAIETRENCQGLQSSETAGLYYLMAENLINSGKAKRAEKWLERGKDLTQGMDDGNLLARLFLRTGRLKEAREILLEKKREKPFDERNHIPQSHRETDILLALIEAFMGNGEESKRLSQQGIQQGIQLKSPFVEACGWIRMGHSMQLLDTYDRSLALQCYEASLKIMEAIKVPRGKAESHMGMCIFYGVNHEYEKALEYGRLGLNETEKVQDAWLTALIQLGIGITAVHNSELLAAKSEIVKAERLFLQCEDFYGQTLVALWKAYLSFLTEEWDIFEQESMKFFNCIQLGEYDFILLKQTTFGPRDRHQFIPFLLEAQKRNIHSDYISKLLNEWGYGKLELHPGYTLRIQTLGTFKVWLGNKEVKERDWQRGKARELLELFVTKKNTLLQKEEIIECLWPELDEKHADRDFKVALNALNGALEPGRKARTQSFFIKRVGSSYGLNEEAGCILDAKQFEQWVQAGLEEKDNQTAKAYLEKGMHLYEGDYIPDRRFQDWCINERDRLLIMFLRGAEKMAQVCVRAQEYDSAIYWCEKIIERDRTWEEAYRLLMYCYYLKNNRPQSLKWYQKCCQALMEEMKVEPLEPTKEMYNMIVEAAGIEAL